MSGRGPGAGRAPGRFEAAALVGSSGLAVAGVWWWLRPSAYPFGPQDRFADMSLLVGVDAGAAAGIAVASGLGSALLASALLLREVSHPWSLRAVALAATAMAVTFGYLVPDIELLILLAYGLTLSLPALATALLVARRTARRSPGAPGRAVARRAVVLGLVALGTTLALLLVLARPWTWGDGGEGHAALQRPFVLLGSVAIGVAWAGVAVRCVRALHGGCRRCGRPGGSWTAPEQAARWGNVVTWAAALTPLPYVAARLTWLTPWPYGESSDDLAAHPGLWVFGLGLAAAGEVGTWLTLGLVRRRGEVLPQWVPVRGGRPVPPMCAVAPGLTIALLMCIGGHSVLQQAFGPGTTWEDHSLVVLVPLPLWGPLLGLATLAYWYRRRGPCRQCAAGPV